MTERELLEIQWAEFYFLLGTFKDLGISEEETILNLGMFLGKFAFDVSPSNKRARSLLNRGIDSGRRWSLEEQDEVDCD